MSNDLKYDSTSYSKFRPSVPQHVLDVVLQFLAQKIGTNEWRSAVDCGCGNGQGTNLVAKHFTKVNGFDLSAGQIEKANALKMSSNITYTVSDQARFGQSIDITLIVNQVSPSETLPTIPSNSVQLLTAFEAGHWFDLDKFFVEANRIVVDNGVVAFVGYHMPEPFEASKPDDKRLTELVSDAYWDSRITPYKNPKIKPVEEHYRNVKFPDNYEFVYRGNISNTYPAKAQDLIGFVRSWSLFEGLIGGNKEVAQKYITEFEENLKSIVGTDRLSEKDITVKFTYFIAMGRKKPAH